MHCYDLSLLGLPPKGERLLLLALKRLDLLNNKLSYSHRHLLLRFHLFVLGLDSHWGCFIVDHCVHTWELRGK